MNPASLPEGLPPLRMSGTTPLKAVGFDIGNDLIHRRQPLLPSGGVFGQNVEIKAMLPGCWRP